MEKIYLASIIKIFFGTWEKQIRHTFPAYKDITKEIFQIGKKEKLIEVIDSDDYDLIIIDDNFLSVDDINNKVKTKEKGLIWLIKKNGESQSVTDNFSIWNENDQEQYYKKLLSLGATNFEVQRKEKVEVSINKDSKRNEIKNEQIKNKDRSLEQKGVPSPVPNRQSESSENKNKKYDLIQKDKTLNNEKDMSNLSDNQKRILAADKDVDLHFENKDDDSPTISIEEPYPMMITDKIARQRMEETKRLSLDNFGENDKDRKDELLLELVPYVNQFFQLATNKEVMSYLDKRALSVAEMYKYVNMNQTIKNKPIGVWSPLRGVGVTSFIMNFALHLGKKRLPLSVMESLKAEPILYRELNWIMLNKKHIPKDWQSYVAYINSHKEINTTSVSNIESSIIDYKGVYWYPLGETKDYQESNIEDITYYLACSNPKEVMLVDLPTGDIKKDTLETLKHLKELWIVLDGSTQTLRRYKNYVRELADTFPNLKVSIVLINYYPELKEKEILSDFDFPVLATLPDMKGEIHQNRKNRKPLLEVPILEEELHDAFKKLGTYIYGDSYKKTSNELQKDNGDFISRGFGKIVNFLK